MTYKWFDKNSEGSDATCAQKEIKILLQQINNWLMSQTNQSFPSTAILINQKHKVYSSFCG